MQVDMLVDRRPHLSMPQRCNMFAKAGNGRLVGFLAGEDLTIWFATSIDLSDTSALPWTEFEKRE
jgi:hypothetical protein